MVIVLLAEIILVCEVITLRTQGPNKINTAFFNLRSNNNLSQEQMALMLGVNRNLIWSIETGRTYGKMNFWIELQRCFHISDEDMWKLMTGGDYGKTIR